MPTYDYECDACQHKFELYQGINDEVKKKCPECKKNKLRRLLGTGAAIVFKGSGFYQTDYRSESYRKSQAADKSSSGSEAGSKGDSAAKADSPVKSEGSSKSESTPKPDGATKSSKPSKKAKE